MANKKFLEEYPLYKKLTTDISWLTAYSAGMSAYSLNKPAIKMYCKFCLSDQTFNMANEYNSQNSSELVSGKIKDLRYLCAACKKSTRVFLVSFTSVKKGGSEYLVLEKVGQSPAWSIEMDRNLEVILGESAEYYKNGLICESQGYGIAAHAYYRRIVEDVIDELLDSISNHISATAELNKYNEAMELVKKTRIAQEKIELVKDLLPNSLKPDGINPLQVIYDELSEGIHYNSDVECLDSADAIRVSIGYLANQVMNQKKEHQNFSEGMKKILAKKANKTAGSNRSSDMAIKKSEV